MTFIHHNFLGDLELNKKETTGIRLYNLPNGDWVPSITSVTSFYNRQIFVKWRKRVGIEEANRITKKATTRGTDFHEAVEVYMRNNEIKWDDFRPRRRHRRPRPAARRPLRRTARLSWRTASSTSGASRARRALAPVLRRTACRAAPSC